MRLVSRSNRKGEENGLTISHETAAGSAFTFTAVTSTSDDGKAHEASLTLTFRARVPHRKRAVLEAA
jgi:hypothetical protein